MGGCRLVYRPAKDVSLSNGGMSSPSRTCKRIITKKNKDEENKEMGGQIIIALVALGLSVCYT